jgi:hypothetical protein
MSYNKKRNKKINKLKIYPTILMKFKNKNKIMKTEYMS